MYFETTNTILLNLVFHMKWCRFALQNGINSTLGNSRFELSRVLLTLPSDTLVSKQGYCLGAEKYYAEAISLPMYPGLTDAQQQKVVSEIQEAIVV